MANADNSFLLSAHFFYCPWVRALCRAIRIPVAFIYALLETIPRRMEIHIRVYHARCTAKCDVKYCNIIISKIFSSASLGEACRGASLSLSRRGRTTWEQTRIRLDASNGDDGEERGSASGREQRKSVVMSKAKEALICIYYLLLKPAINLFFLIQVSLAFSSASPALNNNALPCLPRFHFSFRTNGKNLFAELSPLAANFIVLAIVKYLQENHAVLIELIVLLADFRSLHAETAAPSNGERANLVDENEWKWTENQVENILISLSMDSRQQFQLSHSTSLRSRRFNWFPWQTIHFLGFIQITRQKHWLPFLISSYFFRPRSSRSPSSARPLPAAEWVRNARYRIQCALPAVRFNLRA